MWDTHGFLFLLAGFCFVQKVAMASLGGRDTNSNTWSENSIRSVDQLQRRDVTLPLRLPLGEKAQSVGLSETATAATTAGNSNPSSTDGADVQQNDFLQGSTTATSTEQSFPSAITNIDALATTTNALSVVESALSSLSAAASATASPSDLLFSFSYPLIPTIGTAEFTAPAGPTGVFSYTVGNPTATDSGVFTAPFSGGDFSYSIPSSASNTDGLSSQATSTGSLAVANTGLPLSTGNPSSGPTTQLLSASNTFSITGSSFTVAASSPQVTSSALSSTQTSPTTFSSTISSSLSSTNKLVPTTTSIKSEPSSTLASASEASIPGRTRPLSSKAIAGIVVGVAIALFLLGALLLYLLRRRRTHAPIPDSPGVYPQEAYLYDPPMDDHHAAATVGPSGPQIGPTDGYYHPLQSSPHGYGGQGFVTLSPGATAYHSAYMPTIPETAETAVPAAFAGGAVGAGAAGASRGLSNRGYAPVPVVAHPQDVSRNAYPGYDNGYGYGYGGMGDITPPPRSPRRLSGSPRRNSNDSPRRHSNDSPRRLSNGNGNSHRLAPFISPADAEPEAADLSTGPYRDLHDPFLDPADQESTARQELWPLNPRGENGPSPPGTSYAGMPGLVSPPSSGPYADHRNWL